MILFQPKVIRDSAVSGARLAGGRDSIEWAHRLPNGYVSDFNGVIYSFGYLLNVGEEISLAEFAERIAATGNTYAAAIARDCANYDRKCIERGRRVLKAIAEWEADQ